MSWGGDRNRFFRKTLNGEVRYGFSCWTELKKPSNIANTFLINTFNGKPSFNFLSILIKYGIREMR